MPVLDDRKISSIFVSGEEKLICILGNTITQTFFRLAS